MTFQSRRQFMRVVICATVLALVSGCAAGGDDPAPLPSWTFEPAMLFPADHSLARPEDGIALLDGRLIVAGAAANPGAGSRSRARARGDSRPAGTATVRPKASGTWDCPEARPRWDRP